MRPNSRRNRREENTVARFFWEHVYCRSDSCQVHPPDRLGEPSVHRAGAPACRVRASRGGTADRRQIPGGCVSTRQARTPALQTEPAQLTQAKRALLASFDCSSGDVELPKRCHPERRPPAAVEGPSGRRQPDAVESSTCRGEHSGASGGGRFLRRRPAACAQDDSGWEVIRAPRSPCPPHANKNCSETQPRPGNVSSATPLLSNSPKPFSIMRSY